MAKKLILGLTGLLFSLVAILAILGFPPAYIISAPGVATGIGSKLLCSSRFVSGFSQEQAFSDLVQYSSILDMLEVEVNEQSKSVTASFLGISTKTASYIEGLGCAVDYQDYSVRNSVKVKSLTLNDEPWPLGDAVVTYDATMQALLESIVAKDNAQGLNTRALLAVHSGQIVAEAYAQGADAATPLLGWSMAKSLTAVMLGNLEMRGILDLDSQPGFSQWSNDSRAGIKIVDLLTMSDGLDFSEEYNPGDDATTMLFTSPSASDFTLSQPAAYEPGTHYNYSSGTANILARIYFEALGGPQGSYDDFINRIAEPLGFQNAVFETDASGVFYGSSYLYASARDWARLGELMVNGGVINGQRLVTEDWVKRATTPNDTENFKSYGYQWWLNRGNSELAWPSLPADAFAANGNRQQHLMVIPSKELVIVRLGWTAGRYPVDQRFSDITEAL